MNESNAPRLIECLCFSKDRPLQLDAYLRSLRWAMPVTVPVTVLYTTSTRLLDEGYAELIETFPDVRFVRETDFGAQLLDWLHAATTPFLLFGCDDVVYHRKVDLLAAFRTFLAPKLFGFSLRLGRNVRYRHGGTEQVDPPPFATRGPLLRWVWTEANPPWGYPFELDGTLYRADLVRALVGILEETRHQDARAEWRHPNLFELHGNATARRLGLLPEMASFEEAKLIVPTVNRVQDIFENSIQGLNYAPEQLEWFRRQGSSLDIGAYRHRTFDRIHIGEFILKTDQPATSLMAVGAG